jgi:hypothetical protein
MALADTVAAQLSAIQSGEQAVLTAALTQAFNDGASSVPSANGDVTAAQEAIDIQAAVTTAVAPLNSQIAALQLTVSQEQALLSQVQASCQAIVAALALPAPPAPAA